MCRPSGRVLSNDSCRSFPENHGVISLLIGLPYSTCCHTFRATGITAYLEAGGTIENAQAIAAHESPRTTKLYDRTGVMKSRSMRLSGSRSSGLIHKYRYIGMLRLAAIF